MRTPTWLSWSSGKDAALALRAVSDDPALEVVGLLTTLNGEAERVAMHAVRRELLEAQAAALSLPLHAVDLPSPCPNEVYEARMAAALATARAAGVARIVFGDVALADVRAYREAQLAGTGVAPVFPLWQRPTDALAAEIIDAGIRAVVTCVDPAQVPAALVGRAYDAAFLADLPAGADPCGENGEFHTFVCDAPSFSRPVPVEVGDVVERGGFVYCDLVPAGP